MSPQTDWALQTAQGESVPLGGLLSLLDAVEQLGHIAGACRRCGFSYRHGWGLLRKTESLLGAELLTTSRRQGSQLTGLGRQLLLAYRKAGARLAGAQQDAAQEFDGILAQLSAAPQDAQRLRLHASHGFAVEALQRLAPAQGLTGLELRYRSAIEALMALHRDDCDLAGFQVPLGPFQAEMLAYYRPWLDAGKHRLVYLAQRETGLFVQRGNPKGIRGVRDLTAPGVRFVNRQPGSGTRLLLELMLRQQGLHAQQVQGYDSSEFTHMAVAAHIASGMADAGMGVRTAAERCGLDFIPLAQERYFFAVREDRLGYPVMRQWLALLRSAVFRAHVSQLPGYDAQGVGTVLTLGEIG
jgi:molybdate transport repressor ModE-like protein